MNNENNKEEKLTGILPKRLVLFRTGKVLCWFGIGILFISILLLMLVKKQVLTFFNNTSLLISGLLYLALFGILLLVISLLIKKLFLKKAPFDDWIMTVARKYLSTEVIFYDSKYIYVEYDRNEKEADKHDFVTNLTDLSDHYSYFFVETYIDDGFIQVKCEKKEVIQSMATLDQDKDDLYWNLIPMGLAVNTETRKVSPIGWYLNDNNKNKEFVDSIASTSLAVSGSTGCIGSNEIVKINGELV